MSAHPRAVSLRVVSSNHWFKHVVLSLVFMGSQKYPYTGILDHFANRAFAGGTNAWTDIDHTSYTVSTAGEQGFLQLLPIYVDHILYPTLTDAAFVIEVCCAFVLHFLRELILPGSPHQRRRRGFWCCLQRDGGKGEHR